MPESNRRLLSARKTRNTIKSTLEQILKDWLIIIPARLGSTRLPRKPLQLLGGEPLISRVYESIAPLKKDGASIIVATDSEVVVKECIKRDIPTVLTDASHKSGSDRCFEVSKSRPHKYILNVQGDEPFTSIKDLTNLINSFALANTDMGTMAYRSTNYESWQNPNTVKAICNVHSKAIYFSRSPIPSRAHSQKEEEFSFLHHMGIYAFKKESLARFCKLPQSHLEKTESLEQLRAIENEMSILVVEASKHSKGIDTPEDLQEANKFFKQ